MGAQVLARLERVSAAAAVARADVEEAVGAELELAAVVVAVLAVLDAQDAARARTCGRGCRGRGTRPPGCRRRRRCNRRRSAATSRSSERRPSRGAPAPRPPGRGPRCSGTAAPTLRPRWITRIVPPCSTTKSRRLSPGGAVTYVGSEKVPTRRRRRPVTADPVASGGAPWAGGCDCSVVALGCSSSEPSHPTATSRASATTASPRAITRRRMPECSSVKALVTGATGFVGGRLAQRLSDAGVEVRAMVRDAGAGRSSGRGRARAARGRRHQARDDARRRRGHRHRLLPGARDGARGRRRLRGAGEALRLGIRAHGPRRGRRARDLPGRAGRAARLEAPPQPPPDGRRPARGGPAAHVLPRRDGRGRRERVVQDAPLPRAAAAGDDRARLAEDDDPAGGDRGRARVPGRGARGAGVGGPRDPDRRAGRPLLRRDARPDGRGAWEVPAAEGAGARS